MKNELKWERWKGRRKKKKKRTEEQRKKRGKKKEKGKKLKNKRKERMIGGKSDLTRQVGLVNECLITKMPHNSVFHNLKTPKMCFQFP